MAKKNKQRQKQAHPKGAQIIVGIVDVCVGCITHLPNHLEQSNESTFAVEGENVMQWLVAKKIFKVRAHEPVYFWGDCWGDR